MKFPTIWSTKTFPPLDHWLLRLEGSSREILNFQSASRATEHFHLNQKRLYWFCHSGNLSLIFRQTHETKWIKNVKQNICFTCSMDLCLDFHSLRMDYQQTTWCNIIIFVSAEVFFIPLRVVTVGTLRGLLERVGKFSLISESINDLSWREKLN